MNEKLGQDSAFPIVLLNNEHQLGMSKRLLIAKDVLCALLSNSKINPEKAMEMITASYTVADELLKQENL